MGETPGTDYRKIPLILESGIDFTTLQEDSFPCLVGENSIFVCRFY